MLAGSPSLRRRTDAGYLCRDANAVVIARLCRSGHEHFRRPHSAGGGDGHCRGVGEGVWGRHGASPSILGILDSSGRAVARSRSLSLSLSRARALARTWSLTRAIATTHSLVQSLRTYVDQTKGFALATFGSIQGVYLAKKLLESGACFVGWLVGLGGWGDDTLCCGVDGELRSPSTPPARHPSSFVTPLGRFSPLTPLSFPHQWCFAGRRSRSTAIGRRQRG